MSLRIKCCQILFLCCFVLSGCIFDMCWSIFGVPIWPSKIQKVDLSWDSYCKSSLCMAFNHIITIDQPWTNHFPNTSQSISPGPFPEILLRSSIRRGGQLEGEAEAVDVCFIWEALQQAAKHGPVTTNGNWMGLYMMNTY